MIRSVTALLLVGVALAAPGDDGPSAPTIFPCCDNIHVQRIVVDYVDMVEALAVDDIQASGHAFALASTLKPKPELSADENAVIEDLRARVDKVKNEGLDPLRTELADIGRGVIFLALRHEGGSTRFAEAHCPDEGPWLQRRTEAPKSPWGGRCARWR